MAKLYYDPDLGGIHVRADDDDHGIEGMVEVTAEQATAISLSSIRYAIAGIGEALDEHTTHLRNR